ncbi:MAG: serine hydrolase domain-containing protein [Micromonosporaceae bacterium]
MGEVGQQLELLVRKKQKQHRVPALQAAVHRADRPLWTFQVGTTGNGTTLDAATQFRIGSVTKTFTAVMVMQCRDEGLCDLDDSLADHLTVPKHGELTLRRLLSHTSGLQREPYGDIWDTLAVVPDDQAVAELARAERVLPPSRRFHYSNLGFALLGQLVAAKRKATWEEVLLDRVLRPLGLQQITTQPTERAAQGYLVDAYSDHVRPEPQTDLGGYAAAGQLWGTAGDMARWAAFLADPGTVDPDGAVLAADTLDEMTWPLTVRDQQLWSSGLGLGLIMFPQGDRVVDVGHGGAMPGFLADVYGRRGADVPPATGAAVLLSSGTAVGALELSHQLLDTTLADDPPEIAPWRPGEPAPEEYRSVLGRWWGEGFEYVFAWRQGRLESRPVDAPDDQPPAVFAPEGLDLLRTVAGREIGEQLRLTRDGSGQVVKLHWATYRFTRTQESFDGISASEP